MKSILTFVAAQFPDTEVIVTWNKPHVKLGSLYLLGMEACKNHLFVHSFNPRLIDAFTRRLRGYVCGKRSFHIALAWKLDADLLRDMVSTRTSVSP